MDPVSQLNAAMAAAVAALAAGNYPTAINQALAAQGLLACLPKISRSAGAGGGEMSAAWDAAGIDNFIRRLRQQQGAALGVQTAPAEIVEPAAMGQGDEFANSSGGYVQ